MKGIVIYKGKYGATGQYAQWLGEALRFPVLTPDQADEKKLLEPGTVIIGTSVYIGKLQISQWLKMNEHVLQNKKLFFFLVAGTPAHEKEKLDSYIRSGVPASLQNKLSIFFLPGRLIISGLSWLICNLPI